MNWPDYAVLAVLAISVLVGALRGFIKEVFSLLVWSAAFLIAYHFAGDVAKLMEDAVTLPSARTARNQMKWKHPCVSCGIGMRLRKWNISL